MNGGLAADFSQPAHATNSVQVAYIKPIDIQNNANGFNRFNGDQFIELTIANNEPKGYKVYATARHGSLKASSKQKPGTYIQYRLNCNQFKTQLQGQTIPAVRDLKLSSDKPTLVFDVIRPSMPTEQAKTHCSMRLDNDRALKEKFAGTYRDQIMFTIEPNN